MEKKPLPPRLLPLCILLTSILVFIGCAQNRISDASLQAFETEMEQLRGEHGIPGMSVAIVHNQKLVYARGFGYADLEHRVPATEHTPYNLASCTKPIAAVALMQCVERGQLDLDTPMVEVLKNKVMPIRFNGETLTGYAAFIGTLKEIIADPGHPLSADFQATHGDYHPETETITVRHHLTHTSRGVPGDAYAYSGDLYADLSLVVEAVTGTLFQDYLVGNIMGPAGMTGTVPNADPAVRDSVLAHRSKYYRTDRDGTFTEVQENRPIAWPDLFSEFGIDIDPAFLINGGAGIVSTVADLARFDAALDRNRLLSRETKEMMFTPSVSNSGGRLPYGLGWFIQDIDGERLVWHYGSAGHYSSMIVKVPQEEITFFLLANSGGAGKFGLGKDENALRSPFAAAFIRHLTKVTAE
ncbi:beta-lactamase family protein [bacterium]|nr:beta-lactamase family protein [bacterium]